MNMLRAAGIGVAASAAVGIAAYALGQSNSGPDVAVSYETLTDATLRRFDASEDDRISIATESKIDRGNYSPPSRQFDISKLLLTADRDTKYGNDDGYASRSELDDAFRAYLPADLDGWTGAFLGAHELGRVQAYHPDLAAALRGTIPFPPE